MIILLSQLAEAKTILYVTNAPTDTPCSSLPASDSLYCNRMANLGYTVKVINEMHAKDNTSTWNEYVETSDAIFLGSDTTDMANKKKFRDAFCGNISSKNKPLFFTSVNNWILEPDTKGCSIFLNVVSANFSDNRCKTKAFKVAKSGFITEGLNLDENITIYPSIKNVKFYNTSDGGWIAAECVPPNAPIDFYPVIYADDRNVFWGLDEPSSFSNVTWEIFERTVLNLMNDTNWTMSALVLPSLATINQQVFIVANVTQLGKPIKGNVNFTADDLSGSMVYDGFWKALINFTKIKTYDLNITAYSKSLRGFISLPVSVGNLLVNITSGGFRPNSVYFVNSTVSGANRASYRILNPLNYSLILEGNLECSGNICSGNIDSMPDFNSLLLEVTAVGDGIGGTIKLISKEIVSTDKSIYKPGDTIKIDFFSLNPSAKVNFTILRPDKTLEIPKPLPMDMITSTYWSKNYTLSTASPNGTYIITVKTPSGDYNKTVDVVAWNPFAYMNKNTFEIFENLILTVGTAESYSNNLDINVSAEITTPEKYSVFLGEVSIKGNSLYNFSYLIPKDYPSGMSTIKISFKDSNNRSHVLNLNFSTNMTTREPSLFVTPSTIFVTTVPGYTVESNITIENTATIDATNILKNVSGIEMTLIAPSSLKAGDKTQARILINTYDMSEGTHTGYVNLYSQIGDAEIVVILDLVGDFELKASEKYAELSSIENNITYLEKLWSNTTNAKILLNEAKDILNETIIEYRKGNYVIAKSKFEEALDKFTELETEVNTLYEGLPDNSYIIWDFALAIVIVIIIITIFKIKGRRKKQKMKKAAKEEPKKEEIFFEPKGGEYRTEYY
jgi:hypothetical protein